MTPNEFLLDETRQWLAKAHDDLRAAEVALASDLAEVRTLKFENQGFEES